MSPPFPWKDKACREAQKVEKKRAKAAAKTKVKAKAAPKGKAKAKNEKKTKQQTKKTIPSPNVKKRGRPAKVKAGDEEGTPTKHGRHDRAWAVSPMAVKGTPNKGTDDERMMKAKAGLKELMTFMNKSGDGQFTDPPAGFCKKFLA